MGASMKGFIKNYSSKKTNAEGGYWRIYSFKYITELDKKVIRLDVGLWKDEASFESKEPILTGKATLPMSDSNTVVIDELYNFIKIGNTNIEGVNYVGYFSDAEEVL